MTEPKKPGGKGGKPAPNQEKISFKEDLAARIEAEHESVQFDAGITVEKIKEVLGVGDLTTYIQEVKNNFANSRNLTKEDKKDAKDEVKHSPIKIKKVSESRPKKRRKQRGKMK